VLGLATLVIVVTGLPAAAQGALDDIELHGFGGWAYGDTDGNAYEIGTEEGSYQNADLALNITATPINRLSIVAQLRGEATAGEDEFELDYGFANWHFSDALNIRIGRVKHPFGIYGDIYDVGTLRPFYLLPQSIYGPNGYTARAYNGVGAQGFLAGSSGWGLQYDLYFGQIEGDFVTPGLLTTKPELFLEPSVNFGFEVNKTVGLRAKIITPVNGLSFSVSTYFGDDETFLDLPRPLEEDVIREVALASIEYVNPKWTVRAEYGTLKRDIDFELAGGYVEAAYKFSERWQLAGRWDTFEIELPSTDLSQLPPFFPQLLNHDEVAIGVNYWFSSNFVVRLSYHQAEGNRAAFLETPEQVLDLLTNGQISSFSARSSASRESS